jgi:hypothetical protein
MRCKTCYNNGSIKCPKDKDTDYCPEYKYTHTVDFDDKSNLDR